MKSNSDNETSSQLKPEILIPLSIFTAISLYSGQVAFSIKNQSEQIANSRPFCLQVTAGKTYKAVNGFADILGIIMQGHGGYHHSVLVVGDLSGKETYHWSYWKNQFVAGTYAPFPIYCVPAKNYFSTLPTPENPKRKSFALLGVSFSIPTEYYVQPRWPGSSVGLFFYGSGPDFAPSSGSYNTVNVTLNNTSDGELSTKNNIDTKKVEQLKPKFGLRGQKVTTFVGNDTYIEYIYYLHNSEDKVVTEISCPNEDSEANCYHELDHNGWGYRFSYKQKDLKDWSIMERKLVALIKSFVVSHRFKYFQ
jgi:hypothetical protein